MIYHVFLLGRCLLESMHDWRYNPCLRPNIYQREQAFQGWINHSLSLHLTVRSNQYRELYELLQSKRLSKQARGNIQHPREWIWDWELEKQE